MRPTRLLALAFVAAPLALAIAQDAPNAGARRDTAARANPIQEGLPLKPERTIASRRTSAAGCRSTSAPTARRSSSISSATSTRCRSPAARRRRSPAGWRSTPSRASAPTASTSCSCPIAAARRHLWIISLDKKDTVQITRERTNVVRLAGVDARRQVHPRRRAATTS